MAAEFTLRRLIVLAYAQGFTQWVYQDQSAVLSDILASEFFCPAADLMRTGDHIHVSASDGGALLWVAFSNERNELRTRRMLST